MHISETPIKVRYAETDQMGVVYHTNYIIWFELGRSDFFETLGFDYLDVEEKGYLSPVTEVTVKYHKPVLYKNKPVVRTKLVSYDGIRITYGYEVYNEYSELCVTGTTSHVIVTTNGFRPISIRKVFPNWHEVYSKNIFKDA